MIINGQVGELIHAKDRGFTYGDGVFRSMLLHEGKINLWPQHFNKLKHDCISLGINCPSIKILAAELDQLIADQPEGVAKIVITRGIGTRGYSPISESNSTRVISISPSPQYPDFFSTNGVSIYICHLRLGHQPRLAGIKHLNRLENVLAAAEWQDPGIAEGLLLDEEGHIIEGTRSNLFLVKNGNLYTPDLSRCGVAGLQRDRVLEWATQNGVSTKITNLFLDDLLAADEAFMVNSVIGLWPIREMSGFKRDSFPISHLIQNWLNNVLP